MSITDRDLQEWAHHPITQHFRTLMLESEQETKDMWASEAFPDAVTNAAALGGLKVLRQVVERIDEWKKAAEPDTED